MKTIITFLFLLTLCILTKAQTSNSVKPSCTQDADKDGVADCKDKCPETPNGARVDVTGCMKDTDGDGVMDFYDKQLITPTECQPVDENGVGKCPQKAEQIATPICGGINMNNRYINFKIGTNLSDLCKQELSEIAQRMRANPSFKVVVEITYTNNANLKLNTSRAKTIIDYLENDLGIDRDRFIFLKTTVGNLNTVVIRKPKENETGPTIKE